MLEQQLILPSDSLDGRATKEVGVECPFEAELTVPQVDEEPEVGARGRVLRPDVSELVYPLLRGALELQVRP